jgi:hypothetical protein
LERSTRWLPVVLRDHTSKQALHGSTRTASSHRLRSPPGTGGFAIETTIDDLVADLGLGVDFISGSGSVLRVQYDGRYGDQTELHGGSAKISVPF